MPPTRSRKRAGNSKASRRRQPRTNSNTQPGDQDTLPAPQEDDSTAQAPEQQGEDEIPLRSLLAIIQENDWPKLLDDARLHLSEAQKAAYRQLLEGCETNDASSCAELYTSLASLDLIVQKQIIRVLLITSAAQMSPKVFEYWESKALQNDLDVDAIVFQLLSQRPEVLKMLTKLNWHGSRSVVALRELLTTVLKRGKGRSPKEFKWLLDNGGKVTPHRWKELAERPPPAHIMDFLLKYEPKGILCMGMLQQAATKGKVALVKKLIEAGADVNHDPPRLSGPADIREAYGPFRALYDIAYWGRHAGQVEAATVLLKHGADPNMCGGAEMRRSALYKARQNERDDLVALYEAYEHRPENQHVHKFDSLFHRCQFCDAKERS